jgi:hypothetical protein
VTNFVDLLRKIRGWLQLMLDPLRHKQARVRASRSASLAERIEWETLPRTHFGYGVHRACVQAKALGINTISVMEFGCAGGSGLVELENMAEAAAREVGVGVEVFGFDIGEGLPPPQGARDLPYAWKAGQFKMDIPALKARLRFATLVLGDVRQTVRNFLQREQAAPIGFISFDLDYYSSTVFALGILEGDLKKLLPRVYCYFDDIIGPDQELHSEFAGELLAIGEFNARNEARKIAPIHGLAHKRIFPAAWNDSMFVLHAFEHPLYNQYIGHAFSTDYQLALSR